MACLNSKNVKYSLLAILAYSPILFGTDEIWQKYMGKEQKSGDFLETKKI